MALKIFITNGEQVLRLKKAKKISFTSEELATYRRGEKEDFEVRKKPARHVRIRAGKPYYAGKEVPKAKPDTYVAEKPTKAIKQVMHKLRLTENIDDKIKNLDSEIKRLKGLKQSQLASIKPVFDKLGKAKILFDKYLMSVQKKEYYVPQYEPLFQDAYKRLTDEGKREVDNQRKIYQTLVSYLTGYIKVKKSEDEKLNEIVAELKKSLERLLDIRMQINDLIIPEKMRKAYAEIKKWNQVQQGMYPFLDENPTTYPDSEMEQ